MPFEIAIRLQRIEQLLDSHRPAPFQLRARLDEHAEDFIIEQADTLPRDAPITLVVGLPASHATPTIDIQEAIRQHFAWRRERAEMELAKTRREGWRSLGVGFVFLSILLVVIELLGRFLSEGPIASTLVEGLTILGWVSLWRPAELLLYDWRPFRREAELFRRLQRLDVELRFDGAG